MSKLIHIGDVLAIDGEPIDDNPYKGPQLRGDERIDALRRFRDGERTTATIWYGPSFGGAYQITDPAAIDWSGLRGAK